ncbi:MAG: hypothetical protein MJ156_02630, partial [Alphaproteobacteria bacterium]|nr:hypothetical protein [Alphaproteobacteria bacterium]
MNAIFVESHNNYMAKSATDDMSWTPSLDKRIYKLLTYIYGGVCVCSKNTYALLPNKMKSDPNRLFIVAQRDGENNLIELDKRYHNA